MSRTLGEAAAETPQRESARMHALGELDMVDTPRDPGLDRLVALIMNVFSVDIGIVSLIDAHRQWYKACCGLPHDEVPRRSSFCQYVVEREEPLIVQDASKDPAFADHPAVTGDFHVRFYAGVPLRTPEGHVIGSVCAIDRKPRSFSKQDLTILEGLAQVAMDRLQLLNAAATDALTGLLNRRAFKDESSQLISAAIRHRQELACIMLDIDHFKHINDTFGHTAGDEVLKTVASVCRSILRTEDRIGRLGGEEFAILLPQSDRSVAAIVAERLRQAISAQGIPRDSEILGVTASFGISSLSIVGRDVETLLAQAEAAMCRAKTAGRNQCVSWDTPPGEESGGPRRRVLKSGSIIFNDRSCSIDCTVKSLGSRGAGLRVSNSIEVPPAFILAIPAEGFETECSVIAQDAQNVEVAFR